MPEHDDGDRLRRELLRQAPVFDFGGSLPDKVSALVRRRQRRRRALAVGAAVAVVAAVAIPLSALRSTPVGERITPATTPPSSSTTTPATSTPTTDVALPPLSCDNLDLWTTPAGTAVTTTAALGDVTATLTGTALSSTTGSPELVHPRLSVAVGADRFSTTVAPLTGVGAVGPAAQADTVVPWSLLPPSSNTAPPNSDALCLARFPGGSAPTVLLGLTTDGAHCCTVVRALALSSAGIAPAVDDNVGNPAAVLEADGAHAMIVTADNAFAYQFASFAGSGMPLELQQFEGGRFIDITAQRPDLITADAAMWWRTFNADAGRGLGVLAPWVADECALGLSSAAWTTVGQLEAEGKLVGESGSPTGAAYVQALKAFLAAHGYC